MKFYRAISFVAMVTSPASAASSSSSSSTSSGLNGWYPCSGSTFSDEGASANQDAECAVYSAPLCYPGICENPESITTTTADIFVKRIAALNDSDTPTNVWIMQGGPGASSTAMESTMVELHARLDGTVNVYTMDHRGTGRSTLLDCVAAQATTTGSPWGNGIDIAEVLHVLKL
ncbi:Alpha/Beta hydrolase fold [Phytophthora cactorum]|nr:Alpha/Beta hydrolase fold [Phytophthora cactorum]